jgi:DNA-binding transcriptional MerR regulator
MVKYSKVQKRYYINEIIKELGISRKTYYLWEQAKKIPLARRDPMSNFRYWTAEDLKKLKKITGRG